MIVVGEQKTMKEFGVKSVLIPESPCLNHSIRIELNFKKIGKDPLKSEEVFYSAQGEYCKEKEKGSSTDPLLGLMIGLPVVILTLCCVAVLLLVWRKKLKDKEDETFDEEDENPVYGIYAGDDEADDTAEVTDSNAIYGGEEEEEGEGGR